MKGVSLMCVTLYISIAGISCQQLTTMDLLVRLSMKSFWETGTLPRIVTQLTKNIDIMTTLQTGVSSAGWAPSTIDMICSTCGSLVNEIYRFYMEPAVENELFFDRMLTICSVIGDDELCHDGLAKFMPLFTYLFDNGNIVGKDVCGMMLMQLGCKSDSPQREWEISLPDTPKPPIERHPYPKIAEVPTYKILLLTDIHYDKNYSPGSNAACRSLSICCHNDSRGIRTSGDEAGYWGDYRLCDIPKRTVELILQDAADRHPDIDLIISLGDHIAHDITGISRKDVVATINETFDLIEQYFPGKPLLPLIGNHDIEPLNAFAPPYIKDPALSATWIYRELAQVWQKWLPKDAIKSFSMGGYYSALVKPGLRMIIVNSNYCYAHNWWLILDSRDVANNLQFLLEELQKAEYAGEKAYILSHMSPGSKECDRTWSREFNKIINRYENVVVGLFHGHSHSDYFEIYFDSQERDRPYTVGHTVPSVTTYAGFNPGYKIHTIEGDFPGSNFRVLDGESYILDLEAANTESNTNITKLYSVLEDYQLVDMSPESLLILVKCMHTSGNSLYEKFFRHYHKNGTNGDDICNNSCKTTILCKALQSDRSFPTQCKMLEAPIDLFNMRSPDAAVRCGEICYKNCDKQPSVSEGFQPIQELDNNNDIIKEQKEEYGTEPEIKQDNEIGVDYGAITLKDSNTEVVLLSSNPQEPIKGDQHTNEVRTGENASIIEIHNEQQALLESKNITAASELAIIESSTKSQKNAVTSIPETGGNIEALSTTTITVTSEEESINAINNSELIGAPENTITNSRPHSETAGANGLTHQRSFVVVIFETMVVFTLICLVY